MPAVVVGDEGATQPQISLGLVFRLMEMVERLVHLLDGAKRPLDLALGARGRAPLALGRRHMREHAHAEAPHDGLEDLRPADRAVIHVDHRRDALERQLGLRLGCHGVDGRGLARR